MYEQGSAALQRMGGVREPGLMDRQINNHQWKAKGRENSRIRRGSCVHLTQNNVPAEQVLKKQKNFQTVEAFPLADKNCVLRRRENMKRMGRKIR